MVRLAGNAIYLDRKGRSKPSPVGGHFWAGPGNDIVIGGDGYDQEFKGGRGDDLLVGGAQVEAFYGGPGNDHMIGAGESDYFYEGHATNGSDTLVGGLPKSSFAADVVLYRERRHGVIADLDGRRDDGEQGEGDRLVGIEEVQGGAGADRLTGNRLRNVLGGGAGADVLSGQGGNDGLSGGSGGDLIDAGPGSDAVLAGDGSDRVLMRDGFPDTVQCDFPDGRRGFDQVVLDGFDYFENAFDAEFGERPSCEQVERDAPAGVVLREPYAVVINGEAGLELGCPGDGPERCEADVLLLLRRGLTLGPRSVSVHRGTREVAAFKVPTDLVRDVRSGRPQEATVEIRSIDPEAGEIQRTMPVTLCSYLHPC